MHFPFWHKLFKVVDLLHPYLFIVNFFLSNLEKDWEDIKFGVENGVDYYAVSFVKDAQVVHELKDYLRGIANWNVDY